MIKTLNMMRATQGIVTVSFMGRTSHIVITKELEEEHIEVFYASLRSQSRRMAGILGSLPPLPLRRPTDGPSKPSKKSKTFRFDGHRPKAEGITNPEVDEANKKHQLDAQREPRVDLKDPKGKGALHLKDKKTQEGRTIRLIRGFDSTKDNRRGRTATKIGY